MKIFNSMKIKTSQKLLVILLPLSLAILLLACSPSTNDKTKPKPKPKVKTKTEVTLTSSSANLSAVKGTEVATGDKITITKKPKGATGKWSVDPPLPAGLVLTDNADTATISGTPGTAVNTSYTITFTPEDLSKYDNNIAPTITINIEVSTPPTPVSIDEFTLDLKADGDSIDGNHKITTNPPEATGTFSGSLPGGLTLNSDGSITGTPVHSVTATSGEDGNDEYTVTFTGSGAFGDASKKILVKIYKYKPADRADLIRAIQIEMKADTGQGANADLNLIDTSAITNMSSLFNSVISNVFTGDVSKWNVKNVKYMGGMFLNAYAFNGDISAWNVSKVENMGSMFSVARAFNQNISAWNVSSVTNMEQMFNNALAFNQDLTNWKNHIQTSVNVPNMFLRSKVVTDGLVPCWFDAPNNRVDKSSCG